MRRPAKQQAIGREEDQAVNFVGSETKELENIIGAS
jgi:hypothetical protein